MMTRRDVMIGGAAALWALPARAGVADGSAFGGVWRVVGHGAPDAAPRVQAILDQIDATMSPWRADSALSRFNRTATRDWQDMPTELCQVAATALAIAEQSEGMFDPSVGPVVGRFGFGPIVGGAGQVEARTRALRKTDPGATLDLCGIAKGHALDEVAAALSRNGVSNALIEIGGEVRALGRHPSGRHWRVAVEGPGGGAAAIVEPGGRALATSAHALNGIGAPVSTSHVIDPQTRRPAIGGPVAVSVLAPSGTAADAWATALLARGEGGPAMARRAGISAMFQHDAITCETTGSFAAAILA